MIRAPCRRPRRTSTSSRPAAQRATTCARRAPGILFSASADGGATYATAIPVDTGSSAAPSTELVEPTIATAGRQRLRRLHRARVERRELQRDARRSSSIVMTSSPDGGDTWTASRRVSPLATSAGLYRSPSRRAAPRRPRGRRVPQRRLGEPADRDRDVLALRPGHGDLLRRAGPGLVGPSTVVGDATAPALVSELVGPPTPSVIAAGGRVTVAWQRERRRQRARVRRDVDRQRRRPTGLRTQIDPNGTRQPDRSGARGDRRRPGRRRLPLGLGARRRAGDRGLGQPPLAGATTEAWAQPVVVQSVPAGAAASPIAGQLAPLGRRLGVATAAIAASPLPATVVAFTDTSGAGQDVHVVGLLHGTTAPIIAPQTVTASKNVLDDRAGRAASTTTAIRSRGRSGRSPTTPGSSVSVADAARGQFSFTAANVVGTDTFEAVATDGGRARGARDDQRQRRQRPAQDHLLAALRAARTRRSRSPSTACVTDRQPRSRSRSPSTAPRAATSSRSRATGSSCPKTHSTTTGSFMLHAFDGDRDRRRARDS